MLVANILLALGIQTLSPSRVNLPFRSCSSPVDGWVFRAASSRVPVMGQDMLLNLGREALLLMVLASLPPIVASLVVGFMMSLFQATTQIQESTLSVVPKLCAAVLALVIAGPWIADQLTRFTTQLLLAMPGVAA